MNYEYAILLLFIKNAAILEDTIAITISPYDLTYANKVLYRKVFSIPLGLFTKKYFGLFSIVWITLLYMAYWSLFSNKTFLCNSCSNCMISYVFSSWINQFKSSVLWSMVITISEDSDIFGKSYNNFSFKCK